MNKNELTFDVSMLQCTECYAAALGEEDSRLVCKNCRKSYRKEAGKVYFSEDFFDVDNWESKSPTFDILKRSSGNYRRIDRIGGPRIRDLRSRLKVEGVALNLGGGADSYEGFINIDLGRYPSVHIVSTLEKIPYRDASVDLLVSNSVLEHIYNYETVVSEIHRVLKPGGYLYLCVPNLCMRHHEFDFHRWTMPGLLKLLNRFDIIEHGSCRGVAYALDTLVEALIVFKTRPGRVREMLRKFWHFLSGPIYRIGSDGSPEYEAMSQTIYALVRKKTASE